MGKSNSYGLGGSQNRFPDSSRFSESCKKSNGSASRTPPHPPFSRPVRIITPLLSLAIVLTAAVWLTTRLAHELVASFQVNTPGLLATHPGSASSSAAIQSPDSFGPAPAETIPESLLHSRLWRAVQADLDEPITPRTVGQRALPLLGIEGSCVVWHTQIGPAGMPLRMASPASDAGDERGTPLGFNPLIAMQTVGD